ncbi:MAG: PAS domain-containing sensor histidine kinase, partial [Victivallales bacterium]|nr:PAS domain-containing sensor histidine kinase [Victivallales bacterium]
MANEAFRGMAIFEVIGGGREFRLKKLELAEDVGDSVYRRARSGAEQCLHEYFAAGADDYRLVKVCREVLASGTPKKWEFTCCCNNTVCRFRGDVFRLTPQRLLMSFGDVAYRYEFENSLYESEADCRGMIGQEPICICRFLPDRTITYVNPPFCRDFGLAPRELIGRRFPDPLPDDFRVSARAVLARLNVTEPLLQYEYVREGRDGRRRQLWTAKAVFDPRRQITEYQLLGVDVTLWQTWEEETAAARFRAEEYESFKSAIIHNISHEIRTPLNAIMGFSELLKAPELPGEKRREFLDIIIDSGNHLLAVVDELLVISGIQAGEEQLYATSFSLNDLMLEIYGEFHPTVVRSGATLYLSPLLPDAQADIFCDRDKLHKILRCLLDNAGKFASQGLIEFGYVRKSGFWEFYVRDTGPGIPAHLQEAIFEPFRQVELELSAKVPGLGVGLSICKAYVTMMGGELRVESAPEHGSTFYVLIPDGRDGGCPNADGDDEPAPPQSKTP